MAGTIFDNGALVTLGLVGVVAAGGALAKRGAGSMAHAGDTDARSIWVWRGYAKNRKRPIQTAYALDYNDLPHDAAEVQEVEPITVSASSAEYSAAVHNSRRKVGEPKGVWRVSGRWPGENHFPVTDFHLTKRNWSFLGSNRIRDLKRNGVEVRAEHVYIDALSPDYAQAVENERVEEEREALERKGAGAMGVRMVGRGSAGRA